MDMVSTSISSSNSIHLLRPSTSPNLITKHSYSFPSNPTKTLSTFIPNTKHSHLPPKASSLPYPNPNLSQPINVNYLQTEFNGHGVSFTSLGESCVVRMSLNNGSVATLMLPSGLVTSYKAPMWHGGLLELLHTSVSEGEDGGGAVIRGGVSLAFRFECGDDDNERIEWSPSVWNLRNVGGSPDTSIQLELISTNSENKIEIKHIVTLQQDAIVSEIVINNLRSSSLRLMGSIIGHLAVSTPEATYAVGLESSNYFVKPPVFSNFSIVPPDFNTNSDSSNLWDQKGFKKLLSGWGLGSPNDGSNDQTAKNEQVNEDLEGEEDDNYKHLTEKMSMIYTSAPRNFTIMDRGKRNSVVVGREGFNELYIFSPGSSHKPYSKYSYLCIGQAALLKPVTILPESEWRGVQQLHNPNL
ncbi:protein NDH-DEPENDENT CYCLIC ELECTRON FLOW 5 [Rutidosis leptorrhynchoides]|uniref:protein NDH-DEPENDENT CYCLIC ELECTRON FLOW 5 n=1 Tax=Rutidosis leptorrhynchoides TaxID=125765 RepID=UPI003A99FCA1